MNDSFPRERSLWPMGRANHLRLRRYVFSAAAICLSLGFAVGCNREATDEEMMSACEHSLSVFNEAQTDAIAETSLSSMEMPSLRGLGQAARCTGSALSIALGADRQNKSVRWTRCVQAAATVDELEECDADEAARD